MLSVGHTVLPPQRRIPVDLAGPAGRSKLLGDATIRYRQLVPQSGDGLRRETCTVCCASAFDRADSFFAPFELMDRQFAELDRQMFDMQRQMDRDFNAIFNEARQLQREAEQQAQRALSEQGSSSVQAERFRSSSADGPSISVQRSERVGPGSYSYYESVQISSRGGYRSAYTQQSPPLAASSLAPASLPLAAPLLFAAVAAAGAYVAATVAFMRNYGLTRFSDHWRWSLAVLWPLLFLFSAKFREQFLAAVRGERPPVTPRPPQEPPK